MHPGRTFLSVQEQKPLHTQPTPHILSEAQDTHFSPTLSFCPTVPVCLMPSVSHVSLPPGDMWQCLGTSVAVTTQGAPGISRVGTRVQLNSLQCTGQHPTKTAPGSMIPTQG